MLSEVSNFTDFSRIITEKIGQKLCQEKSQLISQAAELGRRKFLEKLGWLLNYEQQLHCFRSCLKISSAFLS